MGGERWEYRVVHVEVAHGEPPSPSSPLEDSERLGGVLSPDYLGREFPEMYRSSSVPKHPAAQLQMAFNLLGEEGWELVQTQRIGPLLMVFFKRPHPWPAA